MGQRLRWMILGGLLTLVVVAGGAFAAMTIAPGRFLGDFFFGPRFARGEIVLVQNQQVRDYRIDRGKVKSTRGGNLELRELDGTIVIVPVSPGALVSVNGQPAPLALIARGMVVTTVREGTGPAQQVIAQGPRNASP